MIESIRKQYNQLFTTEEYRSFLAALEEKYPGVVEFRIAETPVFIPRDFSRKMEETCAYIINSMMKPGFMEATARAVPTGEWTPGETAHCHCLAFDFGICRNASGELVPMLIEMQGFPSLFGFQVMFPELMKEYLWMPEGYSQFMGGHSKESFLQLLKETIVGAHAPEEVVLLEITPHEQKTRIDFYCTTQYLGIQPVCITEVFSEGNDLYYELNGRKIQIKRIYNRVISDELKGRKDILDRALDFSKPWNVEWVPHPNWFYRLSKFTLPLLKHEYIPETRFLHEWKELPADLENYVLKPLFSFAGQGVVIDVTMEDITAIKDPENWILQSKVDYADVIETPDGAAKAEIRLMYLWPEGTARPQLAINLARLSKGKMIGTRYNKDKTWVGGSVAMVEQDQDKLPG